jgi:hypothetical protein
MSLRDRFVALNAWGAPRRRYRLAPIAGHASENASHLPPGRPDQRAHQRVVPTHALDAPKALVSESSVEAKEAGAP